MDYAVIWALILGVPAVLGITLLVTGIINARKRNRENKSVLPFIAMIVFGGILIGFLCVVGIVIGFLALAVAHM